MSDAEFRSVLAHLERARTEAVAAPPPLQRVAVLGAGPVGLALACEALAAGVDTRIWSPVAAEVPESVTVRGVHLIGTYRFGTEPAAAVTPAVGPAVMVARGVDQAVAGADAILVATPSLEQASVAGLLAPHVRPEQLVVLVPGRCLGAAEFRRQLRRCGVEELPPVAELAAPPYLATVPAPGRLTVHALLAEVWGSPDAAPLATVWPALQIAASTLATSFRDLLGVLNVAPVVLNVAAADGGTGPRTGLMTAVVAAACQAADQERRAVAFAFGVRDLPSAAAALSAAHGRPVDDGGSLHDAWHAIDAFDDVALPGWPLRRLVSDDVACSLVPLASAGRLAGVPTPAVDALVAAAGLLAQVDYVALGRTLASVGLGSLTPEGVRRELL